MAHEDLNIDLISRNLSGEASAEEKQQLQRWMEADPANRLLFDEYHRVWENMGKISSVAGIDVEAEWTQMEEKIDAPRIDEKHVPGRSRVILRMAVIIVLSLFTALLIRYARQNARYIEILTGNQVEELSLPDGSTVTLNKHSSFRFPRRFVNRERKVFLSGEAYFEVVDDMEKNFLIETDCVRIEVLGTTFNVNAYEENKAVEVVVNTGTVAVKKEGKRDKKIILRAGNRGMYDKTQDTLELSINEDANYLSWKTGRFVFEGATLEHIVSSLSNAYDLNVTIPDDSLRLSRVTVTFDHQTAESIINVLQATLDLEVTRLDGELILKRKTGR